MIAVARRAGSRPATFAVVTALGVAAAIVVGVVLQSGWIGDPVISDTGVYQRYGERIAGGDVPYRDFEVEYPPGALPAFAVPALVTSTRDSFDAVFAGLMIVCLVAASLLVAASVRALGASAPRLVVALCSLLVGTLLLGPFVLTRFDLLPAALSAGAVAALLAGRGRLGAGMLGLAIATKLYPAVLLPLAIARASRRDGRAEAISQLGITLCVVAFVYAPFAIMAPEGVARSVWRQLGRPLQIESVGSGVLLALHHALAMPLDWASGHGSQNLTGGVAAAASGLTTVAGIAALLIVWVTFARSDEPGERFARYAAAAAVAFVAFGKVLSPQFLVWLLPLVPLVGGARGLVASVLLVVACALTRTWFPDHYWALVKQFDVRSSWLVLARDLVLVGLFVVLVAGVRATGRAPARSPSPGRSPGRT